MRLTGTTTRGQSGAGSNDNEIPHSPGLHTWGLTIRCNLVSYPKHHFSESGESYPSSVDTAVYFKAC